MHQKWSNIGYLCFNLIVLIHVIGCLYVFLPCYTVSPLMIMSWSDNAYVFTVCVSIWHIAAVGIQCPHPCHTLLLLLPSAEIPTHFAKSYQARPPWCLTHISFIEMFTIYPHHPPTTTSELPILPPKSNTFDPWTTRVLGCWPLAHTKKPMYNFNSPKT